MLTVLVEGISLALMSQYCPFWNKTIQVREHVIFSTHVSFVFLHLKQSFLGFKNLDAFENYRFIL